MALTARVPGFGSRFIYELWLPCPAGGHRGHGGLCSRSLGGTHALIFSEFSLLHRVMVHLRGAAGPLSGGENRLTFTRDSIVRATLGWQ